MLASNLLRVSVVFIIIGMLLGIGMGMAQNFQLAPAHAHFNLLGFVSLFLAGLYYHLAPNAAGTRLAGIQAWIAVVGAVVFPIGIGIVVLAGPQYEVIPILGSFVVLAGMILFAMIVFRHGLKPQI
jgi:hypothetical protein